MDYGTTIYTSFTMHDEPYTDFDGPCGAALGGTIENRDGTPKCRGWYCEPLCWWTEHEWAAVRYVGTGIPPPEHRP